MGGGHAWAMPVLLALAGCQAASQDAKQREQPAVLPAEGTSAAPATGLGAIDCSFPVKPEDTAKSLLDRFGDQARREEFEGEGGTVEAIVLWPDDANRTVEVYFADADMTRRSSLRLADTATAWTIGGLSKGTAINSVEQQNGRPFEILGFEWDYSGNVIDWNGGKLEQLAGGCRAGAQLAPAASDQVLPNELVGDRGIRSDLPALRNVDPVIVDLWIIFPEGRNPGT
jgi:hypothetical protein